MALYSRGSWLMGPRASFWINASSGSRSVRRQFPNSPILACPLYGRLLIITYLTSYSGSKVRLLVYKDVCFILYAIKVNMRTASESSPLLSNPSQKQKYQNHSSCHVKYRLPNITEKGAIAMIVCNVLVLYCRRSGRCQTFFRLFPIILCAGGCNTGIFWFKLLDDETLFEDSN